MPIEINKPLQPSSGGDESGNSPRSQAPRSLVPNVILRAGALIIDFGVLYFLAYAANYAFRPTLLQFGRASVLLACAVLYLYFALFNGPFGRGATIGKHFMQIRTVNQQGMTLSWSAALIRAAIQLFPIYSIQLITTLTWNRQPSDYGLLGIQIILWLCAGVFVASVMWLLVNPLRRALHDQISGSIVVNQIHVYEGLGQELSNALSQVPPLRPFQRLLLSLSFFIFIILSLPSQIRALQAGELGKGTQHIQKLQSIVGSKDFDIQFVSAQAVAAGGIEAEKKEAELIKARQQPKPGPRALQYTLQLVKYGNVTQQELAELNSLKGKMPQVKGWLLSIFQERRADEQKDPKLAQQRQQEIEQLKKLQVREAFVELQVVESLDLIKEFRGQPVLRIREYFNRNDLPTIGISDTPTTNTLK